MIWFTSDLHFNHDREFIWKARGFNSVDEMNSIIVERFNSRVKLEDKVYILGDLMLGENSGKGIELVKSLNGFKTIICGNHDTKKRCALYANEGWPIYDALAFKENGYHFYLSHYPTLTGNLEKESLKRCTINLFGHTHQTTNFFYDLPYCYHTGVDSHNCYPVSIDEIIFAINNKAREYKEYL